MARHPVTATPDPSGGSGKLLIGAVAVVVLLLVGVVTWLFEAGPPVPGVVLALSTPPKAPPPPAVPPAVVAAPSAAAVAAAGDTATAPARDAPAPPPGFNTGRALPSAPDPELIEKSPSGFLPVIGPGGRQPWQVYARPFDLADKRPRIAIIIGGLAASATETDQAINHVAASVTLAFVPYRRRLGEWTNLARQAGHEVMLELPMEPADYPRQDPGPFALLTALDHTQNLNRLDMMLSQTTGYVGMIGVMGSRFVTARSDTQPMMEELKKRGLLYVDNQPVPQSSMPQVLSDLKLPSAPLNRSIDTDVTRAGIDKKLSELEDVARANGYAIGVGQSLPVTLERLDVWAGGLEARGIVLAPVSAVVARAMQSPAPAPAPESAAKDAAPKNAAAAPPK